SAGLLGLSPEFDRSADCATIPAVNKNMHSSTATFMTFCIRSPEELGCSITLVSNLLQFVQERFVTDLQLGGGAPAIPAGARQDFQDQLLFRLVGSGLGSCLQRSAAITRVPGGLAQEGAQAAHRQTLVAQSHQNSRGALQFAQIAWPRVVLEKPLHVGAQFGNGPPEFLCVLSQEMLHEEGNVFLALAQGRQPQTYSANTVIEIFAQPSGFDLDFEVASAAADEPGGCRTGSVPVSRAQQSLAQVRLTSRAQIGQFLQKNRASAIASAVA